MCSRGISQIGWSDSTGHGLMNPRQAYGALFEFKPICSIENAFLVTFPQSAGKFFPFTELY